MSGMDCFWTASGHWVIHPSYEFIGHRSHFWTRLPLYFYLSVRAPALFFSLAIIISDVINNGWVHYHRSEVDLNYILEVAFLVFVLATIRYAWQGLLKRLRNAPSGSVG
jgi:hypothetical protein